MSLISNTLPSAFGNPSIQTMSSREIADLCEARHNDVAAAISRLFEQGVLRESRKTTRAFAPEGGGRPTEVYDLTKRDTLVVVSGYSAELRGRIIDRWQELEVRQSDPMRVLNDAAAMRGLLLSYTEQVIALEQQNAELTPNAAALDRIAATEGSYAPTDAAKTLGVQPKVLQSYLRGPARWVYRRPGTSEDVAYQDKLQRGLMEHKVSTFQRADGSEKTVTRARITPKGLTALALIFDATAA